MPVRFLTLALFAAVLPACAHFSGAGRSGVTGEYAGTVTMPSFAAVLTMTAAETADGRVDGTATLRRGDIEIYYAVRGARTGRDLTLAFDTDGDDLAVRATVDGGRIVGTATGGDFQDAALALTRGATPGDGGPGRTSTPPNP